MKVRVWHNPDGSVRVTYPNPKGRREGETEAAFFARVMATTAAKVPDLAGLPFVDVDSSALPAREAACTVCGGTHPTRNQWRIAAGKVKVDAAVPNPHRIHAHALRDLDAELAKDLPDPVKVIGLQRLAQRA